MKIDEFINYNNFKFCFLKIKYIFSVVCDYFLIFKVDFFYCKLVSGNCVVVLIFIVFILYRLFDVWCWIVRCRGVK